MPNNDEVYMKRALNLAQIAEGYTSPNPLVGAVLVYNNQVLGEGFHHQAGEPHAEVNAFNSVHPSNYDKVPLSTLYVTLEPCSHIGRTPPCSDLIIQKKIQRVVVAMEDPFEKVAGRGIAKLKNAGIMVEVGLMATEAEALNRVFLTCVRKHRPYVTLKWAQSADGFIDRLRTSPNQSAFRFSNDLRLRYVHRLRATHDAILVGANTLFFDNPTLTNRLWWGKQPTRIILNSRKHSLFNHNSYYNILTNTSSQVIIVSTSASNVVFPPHVKELVLQPNYSLSFLLEKLFELGISSILVEGGGKILQAFYDTKLYDEIICEKSTVTLNRGVPAPQLT